MAILVDLPEEIETKLTALAGFTGNSKEFFIRKLTVENFDELQKLYLSEDDFKEEHSITDELSKVEREKNIDLLVAQIQRAVENVKQGKYFESSGDYKQDRLIRQEKERNGWK